MICRDGSDFRSLELGDMAFNDTVGTGDIEDGAVTEDKLSFAADNDINIVVNAFRLADVGSLSVQNIVDGFVDGFEDTTGVDAILSLSEFHDATGTYFFNGGENTAIEDADLTDTNNHVTATAGTLVDDTGGNGAAKLSTNKSGDSDFTVELDSTGTNRWKFGLLDAAGTYQPNDVSTRGGLNQSSDDSFWLSFSEDKIYFKNTSVADFTFSLGDTIRMTRSGSTISVLKDDTLAHQWTQTSSADMQFIFWHANGSGTIDLKNVGDTITDMTLISNAVTAEVEPDDAGIVILHEPVDSVMLDTDLIAWASRYDIDFTTDFVSDDNQLDATAHGFNDDQRAFLRSTGTLPAGLSNNKVYYVVNETANALELREGETGPSITLTDDGTGTHTLFAVTNVPLTNQGVFDGSINIVAGDTDISGQPSGESMRYMIVTDNTKEQRLHGTALQWR